MKIEDVFVDFGAFPMSRNAGDRDGISAVLEHCAGNHQGEPLVVAGVAAGAAATPVQASFPCGS